MSAHTEILDKIGSMTVLELSELIKAMEEKFGVSAAAAVAVAAPAAGGAAAEAAGVDEQHRPDAGLGAGGGGAHAHDPAADHEDVGPGDGKLAVPAAEGHALLGRQLVAPDGALHGHSHPGGLVRRRGIRIAGGRGGQRDAGPGGTCLADYAG